MSSYNLEAIKSKISQINTTNGQGSADSKTKIKINWFKTQVGTFDVRFVPMSNANGQPFFELAYYDNRDLSERRQVVPSQFGLEDPIRDCLVGPLSKDRSKEAWFLRKKLSPRERYYAAILVRGEEEKGIQIWELTPKLCKDIYAILVHPDYVDENMFDAETGYDFTVTVTLTDKKFNDQFVKDIKFQPRRKSSKLLPTKAKVEELLATIPNLEAYFRAIAPPTDMLQSLLENFLSVQQNRNSSQPTEPSAEGSSRGSNDAAVNGSIKNIEDAFSDL